MGREASHVLGNYFALFCMVREQTKIQDQIQSLLVLKQTAAASKNANQASPGSRHWLGSKSNTIDRHPAQVVGTSGTDLSRRGFNIDPRIGAMESEAGMQ